jgi:hypothetical protein
MNCWAVPVPASLAEAMAGKADPELQGAVDAALDEPAVRVRPLVLADGRKFWLKRVEQLAGRMRLQKGDPARSFNAEREAMRELQGQGMPVAGLALEGPGWIVLPDAGPTLPQIIDHSDAPEAEKLRVMTEAGRALARLHLAGLVHGRPAVRDICWDGVEIRFIDLELCRRAGQGGVRQAIDLLVLAQSAFARWPNEPRWIKAAFAGYRGAGPLGALRWARRLALLLAPLGWLAGALLPLRSKSRELRALSLVLPWLRKA